MNVHTDNTTGTPVFRALRESICTLEKPFGTVLREIELAEEFGVSRTPIRQALHQLAAIGLVETRNGVGTIVIAGDPGTLEDIYRLRIELTVLIGKFATTGLFAEWIQSHDEDRANGLASDVTRITTSIVFSMPGNINAAAVKDAVRALAHQEFGGRHEYVMALHTDTKHPHVHLTLRTVGHDGVKLNLRKADLQHLRDTFASKLRQRGIEAESTPRSARGVTRRGERTPVYKIRQRGEAVAVDKAKQREVRRDVADHGGQLPDRPWDTAIVARRNRVMTTYSAAAAILARSPDPEDRALARATEQFTASLTDVTTERATLAREFSVKQSATHSKPDTVRSDDRASAREQGADKATPDRDKGPGRER